jgi:hypothetical protein
MVLYRFCWKNNEKRRSLYGRQCSIVIRGRANSALVEFENGQREVVSRNALRKGISRGNPGKEQLCSDN